MHVQDLPSDAAIACNTTEGLPCIFPFAYPLTSNVAGQDWLSFRGCTNYADRPDRYWCATKVVNKDGAYMPLSGDYGYCPKSCPR